MRFSVPQFIDVEDKIVGPLSLRQLIYLIGAVAGTFILWRLFGFFIATIFGVPLLLLGFALAFVKVNNRPFIDVAYAAFFYITKHKLYLWKKTPTKQVTTQPIEKIERRSLPATPKLTQSKLKELAWNLDADHRS